MSKSSSDLSCVLVCSIAKGVFPADFNFKKSAKILLNALPTNSN